MKNQHFIDENRSTIEIIILKKNYPFAHASSSISLFFIFSKFFWYNTEIIYFTVSIHHDAQYQVNVMFCLYTERFTKSFYFAQCKFYRTILFGWVKKKNCCQNFNLKWNDTESSKCTFIFLEPTATLFIPELWIPYFVCVNLLIDSMKNCFIITNEM